MSGRSRLDALRREGRLDLKHFIYRSHVLNFYRSVLRVTKGLPHADRAAVAQHARASIDASRGVRDPHDIRRMLADGRNQLERLKNTLWMAK